MEKLNVEATKIFFSLLKKLAAKSHLSLQSSGYMDLTIEELDDHIETQWGNGTLYSFAHYYEQNSDAMRDPEMVFIVVDNRTTTNDDLSLTGIYPTMYQQDNLSLYEESVTIDKRKVTGFEKAKQFAHCRFANQWLKNIRSQGFLK